MKICRDCNVTYEDDKKFCHQCGGSITENTSLQGKTNNLKPKSASRKSAIAVGSGIFITLAALLYYGQGGLIIQTDIPANVTLLKGDKVIVTAESGRLLTPLLSYRPYTLKITKPGYATIEQRVTPAFGRGTKEISRFILSPRFGAIKVASEPPGAKLVVKNQYEAKFCTTPCEVTKIFAVPSEVEVQLSGYEAYKTKLDIPVKKTHDLGTVFFKGDLKVDSNPSDADVFINSQIQGKTPLNLKELPAKKITLEVRKKDGGMYVTSLAIYPGKETDLGVVSLSRFAAIKVNSTPQGAIVQLDGKRQEGKTPLVLNELEPGKHEIKLENDSGITTPTKELNLAVGEVVDLGIISLLGSIKVRSEPTGARVYINGEEKGVTPLMEKEVMLAKWTTEIEITKDNLSFKKAFTLKPGETQDLGVVKLLPSASSPDKYEETSLPLPADQPVSTTTPNIIFIPNHAIGDTYVTEVVNPNDEKNNFKTERRVVSVAPGKIVVESKSISKKGTVRVLEYTPEWNIIRSRNPNGEGSDFSPPLKYYEFPLSSGKKWQQTSVETNTKTGEKRTHTLSAAVDGWDTVTTPAGSFKGIKVITNTELLDHATGQKTIGSDTSWYVPELRRSVKSETWSQKPDGSKENQIIHLLNYKIVN